MAGTRFLRVAAVILAIGAACVDAAVTTTPERAPPKPSPTLPSKDAHTPPIHSSSTAASLDATAAQTPASTVAVGQDGGDRATTGGGVNINGPTDTTNGNHDTGDEGTDLEETPSKGTTGGGLWNSVQRGGSTSILGLILLLIALVAAVIGIAVRRHRRTAGYTEIDLRALDLDIPEATPILN
eukprot:m.39332 g.39332  ORF g.39332 m.39332 type:complete len:183 (-) comp7945_c0_seq1:164-712(-)